MTAAQQLALALLALVALGTAVGAVLVPGRRWWDRQNAIDWETDDDRGDVIDAWALTPLAESPIFLQTVADLPAAGGLVARFAADVERYVAGEAS